ncbi:alpha/beta hydrolase [Zunongwangia sp. F363]|uniref:Alpha/beta hydrolase n=1 Tax=Autumnicola tepida TaxID=3075595 RepID=A0ABU3C9I5_9FLAO|nr:alpha/beta hydrolase [Zunongwangia sp. F363]MDT0642974.1 alpha/beta hydrolase [Zunongwangia sp. F363]
MIKKTAIFILMIFAQTGWAQELFKEEEIAINPVIDGTLTVPVEGQASSLVILIAGSGSTDRNCNQPMMKNDALKKTAHELAENGIATFRYDKRILKMSRAQMKDEDIRFDDFVEDAEAILDYFNGKFDHLVVAGHSQGSLVGMLAAKDKADAFISIAGAGQSIDKILVEQIGKQMPQLKENMQTAFQEIKENGSTSNYHPLLESIFSPGLQPFLASWIKYNPAVEIAELDIPVLIINGTADIQISEEEAKILHQALPSSELVIIENMNHIFREIKEEDNLFNFKTYNEPQRPLHPEFIPAITAFVKSVEQ